MILIPSAWVSCVLSHCDGAALRVGMTLAAMADDKTAAAAVTVAQLAERCGLCTRQVQRALSALRSAGLISCVGAEGWARTVTLCVRSEKIESEQSGYTPVLAAAGGVTEKSGVTQKSGATNPPPPSFSPPSPPPLTPPAPQQASKHANPNSGTGVGSACLPAGSSGDGLSKAGRELAAKLCTPGVLVAPMAFESRGTEIGAADLVGQFGAEFVAAQLALVLERKRVESKRDGKVYRPSSGYLLMACRGDWAGWNLPASVAAREAAERRRLEVNARHAAASTALANQARAAVDEAASLAAAVAVVRPWARSASPDELRRVVDGVLGGSPTLITRVVLAAARAAAPECETGQRRAAAVHRAIVERVAALVSGSVAGRRVVSVESGT